MYVFMLEIHVYDNSLSHNEYIDWAHTSKLFTNTTIHDIKRYAKYFIQDVIKNMKGDNIIGEFQITRRKIDREKNTLLDKLLLKYDTYTQYFDLDGNEKDGSFDMLHTPANMVSGMCSFYFNPQYTPKFKIGDIVYYNDACDYGEYVVVNTPKPILNQNIKKAVVYYEIKGYAEQWDAYIFHENKDKSFIREHDLKLLSDEQVKNKNILTLRDFISGERNDIENVDNDYVRRLINMV